MPSKRPSVVVTRRLPEVVETRMTELFDVRLRDDDAPLSRAALAEAMAEADVIVPSLADTLDAGLLAQAGPRLKLIANYGAGVDHIDVIAARGRGIAVSNTPGVATEDTADMTMALILGVTRRIPEGLHLMQSGEWHGWAPTAMLGGRIAGRRLGILGLGRVGPAVARRAAMMPAICASRMSTGRPSARSFAAIPPATVAAPASKSRTRPRRSSSLSWPKAF